MTGVNGVPDPEELRNLVLNDPSDPESGTKEVKADDTENKAVWPADADVETK